MIVAAGMEKTGRKTMAINKPPIKTLIAKANLTAGSFIIRPNFFMFTSKIPDLLAGHPRSTGMDDAQGRSFPTPHRSVNQISG